ncbi:MAG: hypothetical protein IT460_13100 [Planctomycetes bacterium]|nr:hypothetical protein [Planctomycetota bacterium]
MARGDGSGAGWFAAAALLALVACGDQNGPLNERGVWKYAPTAADTRPTTAAVGAVPAEAPPAAAPTPAPAAPKPAPARAPSAPVRAGAYKVVAVEGGGTVRVRCKLAAAVTLPKVPVTKDTDRGCHHDGHGAMDSERLVYDAASLGVGNCLVRIVKIDAGKDWPEPMRSEDRVATIDQKGCVYVPHLLAVRTGTQIVVLNSDAADHNIHAYRESMADSTFNLGSPPGSKLENQDALLERAGTYILKCDIHPWMSGHVVAAPHPYFDVTAALDDPLTGRKAGEAVLTDVPPGTWELELWHEGTVETVVRDGAKVTSVSYSPAFTQTATVTVPPGGTVEHTFVVEAR